MAVNKQHSNRELFEFFQSKLSTLNADTALKYRRTVSELDLFVTGHRLPLSDLSSAMLADFSIELLRKGLAKNTVVYHLNILNGLVKSAAKRGLLEATDAPRVLARQLSECSMPLPPLMQEDRFAECLSMLRQKLKGTGGLSDTMVKNSICDDSFSETVLNCNQEGDKENGASLKKSKKRNLKAGGEGKYEDMLLFSLLNGAMSLRDVAMLRKGDVPRYNEISRGIAERNMAPKRDFVFDLRQSYATPKQIYKAVSEGLKRSYLQVVNNFSILKSDNHLASGLGTFDADTLARSIWVACAVKSGATVSEALACVDGSAEYAVPDFFAKGMQLAGDASSEAADGMQGALTKQGTLAKRRKGGEKASVKSKEDLKGVSSNSVEDLEGAFEADLRNLQNGHLKDVQAREFREGQKDDLVTAEENKKLWDKTVNAVLTHEMPRWYAMHLRKGVDYDELRKDINESIRPVPELFYPSETIKKRVGNKTVIDEKPFISHTVFFKSYPEKILPMFSRIGDKAWCYRVTRNAGSPYAVISSRDMKRFQAVIGVFTPDIEVHNLGELSPKPGESVVVIKAGYNNRRGEVEDVINTESGSVIFRVKLSTDQGYEWRIDLDERQIERILE
ncbi:MAG: phage integrase SAM-like domain-containing protein [Muribaculaceae bacterium]|nr:phage integrase SAM-like domain-containing protein [Muribaculaceae bacterium]